MNALLNYLIEASIGFALFYAIYYFLFRKETNFNFNRIYLLLSLVASIAVPFVHFVSPQQAPAVPTLGDILPTYWLPEIVVGEQMVENSLSLTAWQVISLVYATGIVLLLIRLAVQLTSLLRYIHNAKASLIDNHFVLELQENKPTFSFFKYVFIGQSHLLSEEEKKNILEHERIHALHYHSVDILFLNTLSIVFWFNPVIYLYKKTLVQLHEFEADSRAVTEHEVDHYCGLLAKVALYSAEFPIANHFNNSLTLKRIAMIKTTKQTISTWKKIVLFPLVTLFFIAIACQDQVMQGIQEVAANSSVTTEYPLEVQKALDDLKLKNPMATFQVVGVKSEGEAVLDELVSQNLIRKDEVINLHSIPSPDKDDIFKTYLILEKGEMTKQLASASATEDQVYTVVDESASPKGGMESLFNFIFSNLSYPQSARTEGKEGVVYIQFIINENGSLSDFAVIKGTDTRLDSTLR